MRQRFFAIIEVGFIALFFFSLYRLVGIYFDYKAGDEIYEGAKEYVEADDKEEEYFFKLDLEGLQSVNKEIVGWIQIPDTPVDYPLLETDNNKYYLKHTYDNTYSDFGSIFVDCNSTFLDFNTIIYGHNTKNDSMFGSLKHYKHEDYYEKHPYVYILYGDTEKKYAIIAALTVEITDPAYQVNQKDENLKKLWLESLIERSEVPTLKDTPVTGQEKIITLSTCTSRTKTERFILIAEEVNTVWER